METLTPHAVSWQRSRRDPAADEALLAHVTGDRYQLIRRLGTGSQGATFLAREKNLGRLVVLKSFRDGREQAKTTAALEHDHIARVFSETVWPEKRVRVICRQYVPGATLEEVARRLSRLPCKPMSGRDLLDAVDATCGHASRLPAAALEERSRFAALSLEEAIARMALPLLAALGHARGKGALHLNIKPSNLILSPGGRPYLCDFYLFRERFGFTGDPPGFDADTLAFASPELRDAWARGDRAELAKLDGRTDIYSLAACFARLLRETQTGDEPGQCVLPLEIEKAFRVCLAGSRELRPRHTEAVAAAIRARLEMRRVAGAVPPGRFQLRRRAYRALVAQLFAWGFVHVAPQGKVTYQPGIRRFAAFVERVPLYAALLPLGFALALLYMERAPGPRGFTRLQYELLIMLGGSAVGFLAARLATRPLRRLLGAIGLVTGPTRPCPGTESASFR